MAAQFTLNKEVSVRTGPKALILWKELTFVLNRSTKLKNHSKRITMKFRTPEEVISTPEERVVEIFIEIFGPNGEQIAREFATMPEYRERYEKMIFLERTHQEKMRKLLRKETHAS